MSNQSLRASAKRLAVASLAVPVSFVALTPASAQTEQTSQVLPVTVVTAARYEQPIEDVVADITVIDRAEIERYGAGTINELLSRLPGVQSIDVGSPQLFIRGANANMTAVYVDGVRVDPQDKGAGAPPLSLLDLAHVQRIELVRGPISGVYGAKAMGGAIQIFTDGAASGKWFTVGVGSEGLLQSGFGMSGSVGGQWDYRLGLKRAISDGYDNQPNKANVTANMPWRSGALNAALSLKLNQDHKLSYVINANERDEEADPPYGSLVNLRVRSNVVMSGLAWDANWSEALSTKLSVGSTRLSTRKLEPEVFATTGRDLTLVSTYKDQQVGTFTVGIERKLDELTASAHQHNNPISQTRGQTATSVGWAARSGAAAWQVNLRQDKDDIFGAHTSGGAGASYDLNQQWRLSAGVSTGFRAPALEQTAGSYGSATLKPETSRGKELRLEYQQGASAFQVAVFRTDFQDMINTSGSSCVATYFCWANVERASVEGATISGRTALGIATVSANLNLIHARNDKTGKALNYRPDESATIDATAPVADWRVGAQWQGVGQRYYSSGTKSLRGYALLNLHASKSLTPNWTLQTRIDNAADRDHDGDGYNATPGRRWFVGLKWQDR